MKDERSLRRHVMDLLDGEHAHAGFESIVEGFPTERMHERPQGLPHSAWDVLEHLRIAQWDILEFCRNPAHESPKWPEGYWPAGDARPGGRAWHGSVSRFRADLGAMKGLVADAKSDLFMPFAHGDGQTLLREALLVADHNAYHLGQLVLLRRLLDTWPRARGS